VSLREQRQNQKRVLWWPLKIHLSYLFFIAVYRNDSEEAPDRKTSDYCFYQLVV